MKGKHDKAKKILQAGSENPLSSLSKTKITIPIEQTFHIHPSCIWTNSKSSNESMNHNNVTDNPQNTEP